MKTILFFLFVSASLLADSKTEKALQSKVAVLEEALKTASNERTADEQRAAARERSLHQENARISMDNNADRLKIANLTETITVLQSQLHSAIDAGKFQAAFAKNLSEKPAVAQPPVHVDMSAVHEIRKSQIEGREIAQQRNEAVLKTAELAATTAGKAARTADATLRAVKSQAPVVEGIKRTAAFDSYLILVATIVLLLLGCDVVARVLYGSVTARELTKISRLATEHQAALNKLVAGERK